MHTRQWIVVASTAQARVFERDGPAQPPILLSTLRHRAHRHFAEQIAHHLEEACLRGEYDAVWLLGAPPCLGELKRALSDGVRARLERTVATDGALLDARQLERRLRAPRATPSAPGAVEA